MQSRWFVPVRSIYSSRAQLKFRLVPILAFTKAGALSTHPIRQLQLQPQPSRYEALYYKSYLYISQLANDGFDSSP